MHADLIGGTMKCHTVQVWSDGLGRENPAFTIWIQSLET